VSGEQRKRSVKDQQECSASGVHNFTLPPEYVVFSRLARVKRRYFSSSTLTCQKQHHYQTLIEAETLSSSRNRNTSHLFSIRREVSGEQRKRSVNDQQECGASSVPNFMVPPEYVVISCLARVKRRDFSSSTLTCQKQHCYQTLIEAETLSSSRNRNTSHLFSIRSEMSGEQRKRSVNDQQKCGASSVHNFTVPPEYVVISRLARVKRRDFSSSTLTCQKQHHYQTLIEAETLSSSRNRNTSHLFSIRREVSGEQCKRSLKDQQECSASSVHNFTLPPEYVVFSHLAKVKRRDFSSSTLPCQKQHRYQTLIEAETLSSSRNRNTSRLFSIRHKMSGEQRKRSVNDQQECGASGVHNFTLPPEYVVISHLARVKHQDFSSSTKPCQKHSPVRETETVLVTSLVGE